MVDKHLPEIFSFNIEKLRYAQRAVERYGDHVVPPDIIRYRVIRVTVVTVFYVPEPRLVPKDD